MMTTKNSLMGVPYEYSAIAPVKPTEPVRRALDSVDTALAMEEQRITAIRREAYHSDAPILSVQDPAVKAVSFRYPGVQIDPAERAEALRRARIEAKQREDAPVEPLQPLIAPPPVPMGTQIERFRAHLRAEEAYPSIQRRTA
jgi:hypothetical protein